MYELIQALIGLAVFTSIIAIIKPSLFHKLYGKLNRKHALAIFVGLVVFVNVAPFMKTIDEGAKRSEQQTAQRMAEQEVVDQAKAKEKQAEIDRKNIEQAAAVETLKKITLTHSIAKNSIGTPELHVSVKNGTDRTIDGLELHTSFQNNFGEPVGKWGSAQESVFSGQSQEIIRPGKVVTLEWNLTLYEATTKAAPPIIDRIHFSDGTTIENPQN